MKDEGYSLLPALERHDQEWITLNLDSLACTTFFGTARIGPLRQIDSPRLTLLAPQRRLPTRTPCSLQARLRNGIRNSREYLTDIRARLRARLKEQQALFLCVVLGFLGRNLPRISCVFLCLFALFTFALCKSLAARFGGKIELVAYKSDDNTGRCLALELGNPVFGFCEGGGLRKVVDDKSRLGIAVIHGCEGGEALLARCVPYFKLDRPIREVAFLGQEGSWDGVRRCAQ